MKAAVFCFFLLGSFTFSQTKIILSGSVKDSLNKKALTNANVAIAFENTGTVTDSAGNFLLRVKPGQYKIIFSYIGYKTDTLSISAVKNLILNVELSPSVIEQKQVDITGTKYPSSGVTEIIERENIEKMPTILSDVLRSVKILPGVVSNDELSSGYNVRGGNYDQNLIYLNGFEIHRPLLVKEGLEENQSIINQNFVKDLQFFPGGFPADLGDKISSALIVNYLVPQTEDLSISSNLNLLNLSATVSKKSGPLSWITGIRYSYPSLLGLTLQRTGDYKPEFFDFQFYSRYQISDKEYIDLLTIYGINNYKLKPENWIGKYGIAPGGILVTINFTGSRNYFFNNGFYGLKYNNVINDQLNFSLQANYYNDSEGNNTDLEENFYYSPDSRNSNQNVQYLKTGFEYSNDRLKMWNLELKPSLNYQSGIHSVEAGLDFKYSDMNNSIDEHNYQVGPDSTLELPYSNNLNQYFTFRSAAGFITDQIKFSKSLILNAGARILKYFFSNETVVSPRFILFYSPSVKHTFNFNYGYYYQPPGVNELRDNPLPEGEKLVSQRAAHYIAGWEYRAKPKVKYQFQLFYKKMDDLIPYNIKNMQIIYIGSNIMKGFAYGFDFQYQGEVVQGLKSWIGYSFLNAKEKPKDGSAGYQRSLNDQTHTIKIFLQDRTRKHPDFQVHTRIIGGSGLLYHPQIREINKTTGKSFLTYDLNEVGVFPFYFRIDMGMTFDFNFKNNSKLTLLAEVLNVLDNKNVADYNWFSILPYSREYTIGVHQLFSRRFFNVGLEYKL